MLRSMYSGISGLKNHQTKLDVIGNNISNVNTHGFKKSRIIFSDLFSQTVSNASGPTPTTGGINPKQVGLGAQIAAIDTLHDPGSPQSTSRTLDLSISGDGYFMVANSTEGPNDEGVIEGTGNEIYSDIKYTRAGNFYLDPNGYLVNVDGLYLVGIGMGDGTAFPPANDPANPPPSLIDPTATELTSMMAEGDDGYTFTPGGGDVGPIRIPETAQSIAISQDGTVTFVDADGILRWAGQMMTAKFSNASGLEKVGSNYYMPTTNSGAPFVYAANSAGIGKIQSGTLEMSNVDLSEEFTEMIVAQRGFQANSRIITTSDQILEELVNLKR